MNYGAGQDSVKQRHIAGDPGDRTRTDARARASFPVLVVRLGDVAAGEIAACDIASGNDSALRDQMANLFTSKLSPSNDKIVPLAIWVL